MSSGEPVVGVVIPAFQSAAFVLDAVASVLGQSHDAVDVVVVDDGSQDGTAELVAAVADRRLRVVSQANAGVARARNRGAAEVRGELLAFLDADDVWAPDKLHKQIAALERRPEWAFVGSFMHHVDSRGRALGITGEQVDDRGRARVARAELLPCPISSVLFRREAFDRAGGFDESLVEHVPAMVEDLELMSRMAKEHPFGVLTEPLGGYRIHGRSGSALRFRNQRDGARFVRARATSPTALTWEEFLRAHPPSGSERRRDLSAFHYRAAGLSAAERRWGTLVVHGVAALALGPVYTTRRLWLQRGRLASCGR